MDSLIPVNTTPASLATVFETSQKFAVLMNQYNCAMMEVETKLKVLDSEFSLKYARNPIESILRAFAWSVISKTIFTLWSSF